MHRSAVYAASMSASHFPVLRASALQTAAALERYEANVRRLVATWLDMDLYATVSQEIDEIKAYCGTLPDVTLPWSALLVSHAELVHTLWRSGETGASRDDEVAARLAEHLACIAALAEACRQLSDRIRPGPPLH